MQNIENVDYGITNDKMFGMIMESKEYCKTILNAVLPDLNIKEIKGIEAQKLSGNRIDFQSKDVILDVAVTDDEDNYYDIEMQVANKPGLGKRMRYYQSAMDMYTLNKGEDYTHLRNTYLIFLCGYNPFKEYASNRTRYVFHQYEDADKSIKLQNAAESIIINSKGTDENISDALKNLRLLMNKQTVDSKSAFKAIEKAIIDYNSDPKRRKILASDELRAKEIASENREEGRQEGLQEEAKKNAINLIKQLREMDFSNDKIKTLVTNMVSEVLSSAEIDKLLTEY